MKLVEIRPGSGRARVGSQWLPVRPAAQGLHVGETETVLHPISFGQRCLLVREAAGPDAPAELARAVTLAACGVAGVTADARVQALALHLAGAGASDLGFTDVLISIVAGLGGDPVRAATLTAAEADRLARQLIGADEVQPEAETGWNTIRFEPAPAGLSAETEARDAPSPAEVAVRLAEDLLQRAEAPPTRPRAPRTVESAPPAMSGGRRAGVGEPASSGPPVHTAPSPEAASPPPTDEAARPGARSPGSLGCRPGAVPGPAAAANTEVGAGSDASPAERTGHGPERGDVAEARQGPAGEVAPSPSRWPGVGARGADAVAPPLNARGLWGPRLSWQGGAPRSGAARPDAPRPDPRAGAPEGGSAEGGSAEGGSTAGSGSGTGSGTGSATGSARPGPASRPAMRRPDSLFSQSRSTRDARPAALTWGSRRPGDPAACVPAAGNDVGLDDLAAHLHRVADLRGVAR